MKVAAAFLIVLCMLLSSSSGGSKGAKAKEVDLKTKLQQKIFHHHHHHHPHHHHYHHHHHHHPHHHHHHHHDALNKHHHHHHHHQNHHHHYHNPFKHHLHRHHSHKKHFHHHPHKHPLHQHHHSHKKHVQQHQDHVSHHHSNRKSDIIHAPVELPNKLKLHVQIKDSQATKRQSLPDLLANLGQHLMNLGSSITPKKSQMEVNSSSTGNPEIEGDVRNEVPAEPKSPTVDSTPHTVEDSSSTSETIPTDSQRKNVSSLTEVEALLNSALDAASGDEMGSASSENDEAEASGAVTTNIVPKTNEVAQADRRNETFSEEPDIFGPEDSREYNTSERQRESNYTLEEIAEKSFQTTESKDEKDEETNQSDVLKEDKSPVHGDQSKKVESETDILTESTDTNTAEQHEKMHENSDQDKTSQPTSPTLSEELKSSNLNSTLDEGNIDKETIKSGLTSQSGLAESEEPVTEGSAAQDSTEEEVEKTEVSGSGEESSVETKDNTNGHNTAVADEKISQEESGARQESNKPNLDEEEDVSVQSIDQNEKESAEERQEKEDESKSFLKVTAKQATLGESKPVQEENIDQQTVVNVAGNQIMGNQTDDGSFQQDSTQGTDLKKEGSVLEDKPVSNDPEKTVSVESLDQGATIKDAKLRGDLDTPVTQPIFNEPERSISVTNLVKGFQAQNEGTTSQLLDAAVKDLPSQRQTAINRIDYASGAGNFGQESIEGTPQATQDEESQTDLEGFAEGPKTPAVLDELVEPSVPSVSSDPLVVNAEDSQVDDVHEDTSQEMGAEDAADEIPVFTLSTPIGDTESFATDESTLSPLTTPTSAVTSSSASFIDSGLNMSPRDSESPSLLEGYSTFTATAAPSQGLFSSLTQRDGLQRDMLDDPIEESLETAVDSKSS